MAEESIHPESPTWKGRDIRTQENQAYPKGKDPSKSQDSHLEKASQGQQMGTRLSPPPPPPPPTLASGESDSWASITSVFDFLSSRDGI